MEDFNNFNNLGKECLKQDKGLYKFKECVDICPLAMVDDIAAIAKCGADSVELNTIVNAKVKSKFLEFGPDKCFNLHVGKNDHRCSVLLAQKSKLKEVKVVKYLGNLIAHDGSNDKNIEDRWNKGMGINCSVIALLNEVSLGRHYFNMGLLFRESNVLNGILTCAEVWHNYNS